MAGYPVLRVAQLLHDAVRDVPEWVVWDPKQSGGTLEIAGLIHVAEPEELAKLRGDARWERMWAALRSSPSSERREHFVLHLETGRIYGHWGRRASGAIHALKVIDLPLFHRRLVQGFAISARHKKQLVVDELGLAPHAIVLPAKLLEVGVKALGLTETVVPTQPQPEAAPAPAPLNRLMTRKIKPEPYRNGTAPALETKETPVATAPAPKAQKPAAPLVAPMIPIESHDEDRLVLVTRRHKVLLPVERLRRLVEQALGQALPPDAVLSVAWSDRPETPALVDADKLLVQWTTTTEERG